MFEKFTDRARQVIILARKEADRFNHNYIGTEHILLGLIKLGEGVAVNVLRKMGLDFETVRMEVERAVGTGPETKMIGDIPLTARAKRVIELALDEAKKLSHTYIGTEHLLLGLLREGEGVAAKILQSLNVDIEATRAEVLKELGTEFSGKGEMPEAPEENVRSPALSAFGRDLTELAKQDKLDPVIGRADEIERVVQILCRRRKNNPVLLGEAGVGKTAIVEGLAQKIISGDIPENLLDKKIVTLDLALMVAGTKYRGQFEERIKAVMKEIKNSQSVILFIDELHTIVGAGAAEGAIDASNILKPALARGELQCIGATTLDEYRKYIEKDAALERRFQTVMVDPPSVDETIEILKGLRHKYESYHKAVITDTALESAARLSDRYVTGRFLPDKAIDLIDEASARVRIQAVTEPTALKGIKDEMRKVKTKKEASVREQDFEKAARFRDEERMMRFKLEEALTDWKQQKTESKVVVTEEDIAQIVAKWTGIPVSRIEEAETEKLLKMEEGIHKRVVGQDEAVKAACRAVRRSRADLKDPRRPIGSFVFLGPTGVGKTLLAKALAEFMFDDEEAMIQIDMSEYMEKFAISRLTGSPPGYVGYEEGGQLTEQVRRRPYSVILFDEMEKAHPDVINVLLQILEEGKLTDSLGRVVDFRNTILIMTSNIGADLIRKRSTVGFHEESREAKYDEMRDKLMGELKKTLKPEFLNRIDEVIVFHSLSREDLSKIVGFEIQKVRDRLTTKGYGLEIAEKAQEFLIDKGFDPVYGARPLRRAIQRYIEDPVSEELLKKKMTAGQKLSVGFETDHLTYQWI
ncbi:MAG: ATP-dependent Clp protease ATP-binding subunit [Chlamydiae bacterium]|nr:ATP-dependent Clp protease ATP-binding subunit [Chlamydiota bacterium]MBI3265894.1 ATP-dependent Clp protease ATP-binding subunit [Chlamydiota bacterium]